MKTILFTSRAWQGLKHLTIAHWFEKASYSWISSVDAVPAKDEAAIDDIAATADGATTTACLEQPWDPASRLDLVPVGLCQIDFVFADNLVATEGLTTDKLATSVMKKTMINSASNSDCNGSGCAPKPVTSAAAIVAANTIRMFLRNSEFDQNLGSQLGGMKAATLKYALAKRVKGKLNHSFQQQCPCLFCFSQPTYNRTVDVAQ